VSLSQQRSTVFSVPILVYLLIRLGHFNSIAWMHLALALTHLRSHHVDLLLAKMGPWTLEKAVMTVTTITTMAALPRVNLSLAGFVLQQDNLVSLSAEMVKE